MNELILPISIGVVLGIIIGIIWGRHSAKK